MTNDRTSYIGGGLVIAAGELPEREYLSRMIAEYSPVVAADGAAARVHAAGLEVDVVVGDMDSVGDVLEVLTASGVRSVPIASQEQNDLEKALAWMAAARTTRVGVIGAFGGMPDHALNNMSVLARYGVAMRIVLLDDAFEAYLVHDRLSLASVPGQRVSLLPLPAARVTTSGLEWGLRDEELAIGRREGASNRATGNVIDIRVHSGIVMVMHYR